MNRVKPIVSDKLKIKARDITGKYHLIYRDKKTNKEHRLPINWHLRKELADYIERMRFDKDDYIIPSQKGINRPLSRTQAYYVLNATAAACEINEPIGTHTMRKTFWYWHYRQHRDVALL